VRLPLEGGGIALIDAEDEELVLSLGKWERTSPNWSWWSIGGREYELHYSGRRRDYWHWGSHTKVAYYHIPPAEGEPLSSGGTTVYLHDLVMGARDDQEVFPANGDGLDCRKSNLRIRPKKVK
jgi:hypothetical protein